MSFFTIITLFVLGIALLILGFITKKTLLKVLGVVPLGISVVQLIMLLGMGI